MTAPFFAHGSPFPPETDMFGRAAQLNIQPSVITAETVERLRSDDTGLGATLPAWLDALEAATKAELNPPDSDPEDDPGAEHLGLE